MRPFTVQQCLYPIYGKSEPIRRRHVFVRKISRGENVWCCCEKLHYHVLWSYVTNIRYISVYCTIQHYINQSKHEPQHLPNISLTVFRLKSCKSQWWQTFICWQRSSGYFRWQSALRHLKRILYSIILPVQSWHMSSNVLQNDALTCR